VSSNQCSIFNGSGVMGFLERIGKLTLKPLVKPLLMEVFTALTPTSCVNYKAFLETLPLEYLKAA
jgi:hypothetical protein